VGLQALEVLGLYRVVQMQPPELMAVAAVVGLVLLVLVDCPGQVLQFR